jgi:radical SAM superfamily enzyme YgiQ (UPF0313 family)
VKILLVDPPFYRLIGFYNRYFPLGLLSVGTYLRDRGHEVVVYDADYNEKPHAMDYTRLPEYYPAYLESLVEPKHAVWREVRETIERVRPQLIGVSAWTAYAASAFRVAEIAKETAPECPVVLGGPHVTVKAEETLRITPFVDYVVRGDGEITAAKLVDAIAMGGPELGAINGLSYREDGQIRHNPARARTESLDGLPLPDRSLLSNKGCYSAEDMGLVMTSRGCPFSCSFCVTETRQVRYRSIKHVLSEVRLVKARYGTRQFSFKDDSFTVNRKRVIDLCEALISEKLNIGWECNTRVDLVTEEMLAQMKKAGCNSIKVGVESGSEAVLGRMNKAITLDQVRRAAQWLRRAGIHWTGYFLIGTPGETREDVCRTVDLMYEIRPDFASVGVYEPFPGTAMFEEGVRRGLVKADMTLEEFFATLPNDYYKTKTRRQLDTMDQEAFEALEADVKARFRAYNKQVPRLLKRARSRTGLYLTQPTVLLADFKKYLSWN